MFASIKSAALAAILGLGAFAATPALADSVTLGVGDDGLRVTISDHGRRGPDFRRGGYDRGFDRDGYDRDFRRGPACSPWRAVEKAERMGVRRARVVDAGYRGVVVRGHRWGDRVQIVFGNARHCPVRAMY